MRMARKDVHSMKIRAYKSHFGMVVSSVIAICVSFVMAASAIVVDQLTFTLPLFVRNWGTAFLVITLTGMAFPLTPWAWALCRKWNIKPETLPHILIENAVNTVFFNTTATLILAAVNIFDNAGIEAAIAAGHLPFASVTDMYVKTCIRDWPIMFVISYVVAFFITKIALRIAGESVAAAMEESKKAMEEREKEKQR